MLVGVMIDELEPCVTVNSFPFSTPVPLPSDNVKMPEVIVVLLDALSFCCNVDDESFVLLYAPF